MESGTARKAAIPGYRVAGKTGTAEKGPAFRRLHCGKVRGQASSGLLLPRRAEIVAMIAVDEPDPAIDYHGGGVAAPVFSAVVGPTLLYLGVPPDDEGERALAGRGSCCRLW